jgi:hypothetical protein
MLHPMLRHALLLWYLVLVVVGERLLLRLLMLQQWIIK